ncbi:MULTISPECIES: nicotinate-nicotinamide nucleotide adenylyltransferase [Psychrobacter]|uniref:nicotinate-nicotinamide nucleotide adenylyltransferase n=1 Tax=Psychrobacter TaxID=497 RepID=UPI001CB73CD4|nr:MULTISPECIES: nicotinate-nicotinamide nucleotide adenylyltransferase [Psychrobacter]
MQNSQNANQNPAIRAYLGGSFNPVHNGHIQMAMAVFNQLAPIATQQKRALSVELLPNSRSPFKTDTIDPKQRLAMLKLATKNTPLAINELELWQAPPVFTIDTVRKLRQNFSEDTLIFIMGMDSAASLDKWRQGLELTDFVHLWVFNRVDETTHFAKKDTAFQNAKNSENSINSENPIDKLPNALQAKVTTQLADLTHPKLDLKHLARQPIFTFIEKSAAAQPFFSLKPLKTKLNGRIYLDWSPIVAISSSSIREQLAAKSLSTVTQPRLLTELNPTVYDYIIRHRLYSTDQFR